MNHNNWFWEYSPRYWRPIHWGVFIIATIIMVTVMIFGCGIESIVDLIL